MFDLSDEELKKLGLVRMTSAQQYAQHRAIQTMVAQQWNDMMYMAKNCLYIRGFSYVAPDEIILQFSEKCPWMKFHERLQKMEVPNAVNPV